MNMHISSFLKQRPQRRILIGSVAALWLAAVPVSRGTTKTYVGPDNGSYYTAASWSPNGVPEGGSRGFGAAVGDDVILGTHRAGTFNLNVTIGYYGQSAVGTLRSFTLDSSGLTGFMIFNMGVDGYPDAITENIGQAAKGNVFNQSGGVNTVDDLNIAAGNSSNNSYNISGGSIYLLSALNVGAVGNGTFNQTGGDISGGGAFGTIYDFDATITLGNSLNSVGRYNLSGGTVSGDPTRSSLVIGPLGRGVFTQSGGGLLINAITIGGSTHGTGTFNLSGGDFSVTELDILNHGVFNLDTGGTVTGKITIASGGAFNVDGGTFDSNASVRVTGGALHLDGTHTTIFNLTGTGGTIDNGAQSANLTVKQPTNTDLPYSIGSQLQDSVSGKLGVVFAGSGVTQLTHANTYSGPTTVTGTVRAPRISPPAV